MECCETTSDETRDTCASDDEALQPCLDCYGRPCWFNKGTEELIYYIEPPRPPSTMQGIYPNATTAPWGGYGNAFAPCPPPVSYAPPIMSTFAIPPVCQPTLSAVPQWAVPPSTMSSTPMPFQPIMQGPSSSSYAPPKTPFVNVDNTANIADVGKSTSNGDVTNQDYAKKEVKIKNVYGCIKHAEKSIQDEKQKRRDLELELEVPLEKAETSNSISSDIPNTAESCANNDVAKETNASTYTDKLVKSESISNSKSPGENSCFTQHNTNVSLDAPEVEVDLSEFLKNAKDGKLAQDKNGAKIELDRSKRTEAGKEEKDCLKEGNEGPTEEKDDTKKEEEEETKMGEENANEGEEDAEEEEDGMSEKEEAEETTKGEESAKGEVEGAKERGDVTIENEDVVKEDAKHETEGAKDETVDERDETVDEEDETGEKEDTTEKTEENEDTKEEAINERQDTTKEIEALAPAAPRPKKYTTKRFGWFGL